MLLYIFFIISTNYAKTVRAYKTRRKLKRIIGIDFDTTNTACTSPTLNSTLQYFAYNSQCKTASSGDTTKRAGKPQYSVVHSLH
jgi:hypothetical protein